MLIIDREITDNCFSTIETNTINDFFSKNLIVDEDYKQFVLENKCGIYQENTFSVYEKDDMFLYCLFGHSSEISYDLICYNEELFRLNDYVAIGLVLGDSIIAFKKGTKQVFYIELGTEDKKKIANSFMEFVNMIK